jgi:hypothetical protein
MLRIRAFLFFLIVSVIVGGIGAAQAQTIPEKKIKIFNNSTEKLYVIIEVGERGIDEWLQGWFKVTDPKLKYGTTKTSRLYVNGLAGIAPNEFVEVSVPFFTQLVANPDGTKLDQYLDWWNGGRLYFYDDQNQYRSAYTSDASGIVVPVSPAPCVRDNGQTTCTPVPIFSKAQGLPPGDRSQLMEYTFADSITAKGMPYEMKLAQVGYNISSVDQVYLPVAMQPLNNPLVPYIGTVQTLENFRSGLTAFLNAFPGWPVYNPVDATRPRVPEAHIIFANSFTDPPNNVLSPPGQTITNMINLYRTCTSTAVNKPAICTPYQQVLALFKANYQKYKTTYSYCAKASVTDNELTMLQKIYGWVPFNEGCGSGANALVDTLGKAQFDILLQTYVEKLEYDPAGAFNPYVKLIHDPKYLDMAAYAFSIDDAIGFQSYKGDGLIVTFAGSKGLDNNTKLDKSKRVVVTLGAHHLGVREWDKVGICSSDANYADVDPLHPAFEFYPPSFPCMFTATDMAGRKYQLVVQSGPPNLTKSCTGVADVAWCQGAQVVSANNINTLTTKAGPQASTHDLNGDGRSDIVWRNTTGTVAAWLMNGKQVIDSRTVSDIAPAWSIVGQRDFDADGKADLLWQNANGQLAMWFMNGASVLSSVSLGSISPEWKVVGTGDFNADGRGDILWRDTTDGTVAVRLMDGARVVDSRALGGVALEWSIVGTGDFDGDGKTDILWRHANGSNAIWFVNGVTVRSAVGVRAVATGWSVVGTGDFNGDGKSDILWRHTSGATQIWLMNGSNVIAEGALGQLSTSWSVALTGDYNFDGKTDILWRNTDGNNAIWFMNGLTVSSSQSVGSVQTTWTVQSAGAE